MNAALSMAALLTDFLRVVLIALRHRIGHVPPRAEDRATGISLILLRCSINIMSVTRGRLQTSILTLFVLGERYRLARSAHRLARTVANAGGEELSRTTRRKSVTSRHGQCAFMDKQL